MHILLGYAFSPNAKIFAQRFYQGILRLEVSIDVLARGADVLNQVPVVHVRYQQGGCQYALMATYAARGKLNNFGLSSCPNPGAQKLDVPNKSQLFHTFMSLMASSRQLITGFATGGPNSIASISASISDVATLA